MTKFPITVVIPCEYDPRLGACLNSIDADVEMLVALNGDSQRTAEFLFAYPKVRSVLVQNGGIAVAYNEGIASATHDWILLMDSDCVFAPGTISRMWHLASDHIIVKGRVKFQSHGFISKMIALVRGYTTADSVNAYSPPLLFHRRIQQTIGYYFDPRLIWAEDADFNNRVQREKIEIGYDRDAVIYHKPLTLKDDLRSAYRYGVGRQIGKTVGVYSPHTFRSFFRNINKVAVDTWRIAKNKSVPAAFYYFFLWNTFFRWGTFAQHYFRVYHIIQP